MKCRWGNIAPMGQEQEREEREEKEEKEQNRRSRIVRE